MEDAKARLGKFLAKERTLRDTSHSRNSDSAASKPVTSNADALSKTIATAPVRRFSDNEVERNKSSNMLSSPDTFEETKRRVARVKASPVKTTLAIRKPQRESFSAASSPARNIQQRQVDSSSEDTPGRNRRRLILKSPAADKPAIVKPHKPRVSRSLSPLMLNRGGSQSLIRSSSSKRQKHQSSTESTEHEDHEEYDDDDQSILSLPFPKVGDLGSQRTLVSSNTSGPLSAVKPSKPTKVKPTKPDHSGTNRTTAQWNPLESASKIDPSIDVKFCAAVVDDIISWEASLGQVNSQNDLLKGLGAAELCLKRLGLDRILCFTRHTHDLTYVCVGHERLDVPAGSIDKILFGNSAISGQSKILHINAADPRFEILAKLFQLNDSFEAKVMQDENRYLVITLSSSNEIEMFGVFYFVGNTIKTPFHSIGGRIGDAFRSMVGSTARLLTLQVWGAVYKTMKEIHVKEHTEQLLIQRNDIAEQASSRESLLAMALWSSTSEFDIFALASAMAKTASTFSGHSWILFCNQIPSSGDYLVARYSLPSSADLQYEEFPSSSSIIKAILPEQSQSITQLINLKDLLLLRWLDKENNGEPMILIKTSFAVTVDGQPIYCVVFTPLSPTVKKSTQISHMTDLGLISETAIAKAISVTRELRISRWSQASNLLMETHMSLMQCPINGQYESEAMLENIFELLDCIESPAFSSCLSIRRAIVLLDSVLSSELGLANQEFGATSFPNLYETTFFHRCSSGLKRYRVTNGQSMNQWVQDLMMGKAVLFNPSNASLKDFSMTGGDSSQFELLKFVSSFDPDAQSIMLVPINIGDEGTQRGMGIIVLIDNLNDFSSLGWRYDRKVNGGSISNNFSKYQAFDAQFFENFQKLRIINLLSSLFSRYRGSQSMMNHISEMNLQQQELEQENVLLCEAVVKLRTQRILHKMFSQWKVSAHKKKVSLQLKNKEFMLDFVMGMITFRQQLRPPHNAHDQFSKPLVEVFLVHMESWLRKVFPNDSVSVINTVNGLVALPNEVEDNISISNVIVESAVGNTIFNESTKLYPGMSSSESQKTIAKIIISRPSVNGNFLHEDIRWLDLLCSAGSTIYSSLSKGLQQDGRDGDVRSLVIPMIESIIVPFVEYLTTSQSSGYDKLITRMCVWMKKLCGADLVVATFRANSFDDDQQNLTDGMYTWSTDSSEINKEVQGWVTKALHEVQNIALIEPSKATADSSNGTNHERSANVVTVRVRELLHSTSNIGDIKIVMPVGSVLTEDHFQAMQIAIYLFVATIHLRKLQAGSAWDNQSLQVENRKLLNTWTATNEELQSLRIQNQYLSFETSYWIQAIRLGIMIRKCKTIPSIVSCIWEMVPELLSSESVLLAVCSNYVEFVDESSVDDTFVIYSPKAGVVEEVERVTLRQLLLLPKYFDQTKDDSVAQSVIPLTIPGDKKVFAALIVFQGSSNIKSKVTTAHEKNSILTSQAAEDVFGSYLNEMIYCTIHSFFAVSSKVKMQERIQLYEDQIQLQHKEIERISPLERGLNEAQARVKFFEETIDDLKSQLADAESQAKTSLMSLKKNEALSISKLEDTENKFSAKLIEAQEKLSVVSEQLNYEKELSKELVTLAHNFAYDPRCNREEVYSWLEDVAHSRQSAIYSIRNVEELGKRYELPPPLNEIPGIWSAIGESTRTGHCVLFASEINSTTPTIQNKKSKFAVSSGMNNGFENADRLEVLCVPNRALCQNNFESVPNLHEIPCCFVFTKAKSERWHTGFDENDKVILEFAVDMSSRLLVKTSSEVKAEEFYRLEKAFKTTQIESDRLINSLTAVKDIFSTAKIQSSRDLVEVIKKCVNITIHNTLNPHFEIDCQVIFEDQWKSKKLKHFSPKFLEMIHKVKSQNSPLEDAGTLIIPFGSPIKPFGGLIWIEKKLRSNVFLSGNNPHDSVSLEDIHVTVIEQKILGMLSSFSSIIMDKLDCVKDAFVSIEEAGSAISIIQEAKAAVEDKLAVEITYRAEYEQALQMSAEMLSLASSQRNAISQLLDLLRKQLISSTLSEDSYVIIPYSADSIVSEILLESGDPDLLIRALPPEQQINEFFTLLPDNPVPSPVRFETGDLELQAINNFRTMFLPSAHEIDATITPNSWRSWVVRRIAASKRLGAPVESTVGSVSSSTPSFALAVPFYLRTTNSDTLSFATSSKVNTNDESVEQSLQGKIAVAVLVRSTSSFSEIDQLCVSWLTRAFSYCVGMRGGELNAKHNMMQLKQLQKELQRLQNIDQKYYQLQNDLAMMMKAFKHGPSWNGSLAEMLDNSDENIVDDLNKMILDGARGGLKIDTMEKFEQKLFFTAVRKAFVGDDLRFEISTDRAWSDFYVAQLSYTGNKKNVNAQDRFPSVSNLHNLQEEFIREGNIAANVKYTLKFGFTSLRERNQTALSREEIWCSSNSKISQAMCRLEILGKSIQYFLISKVVATATLEDDCSDSSASSSEMEHHHNHAAHKSGFNLMNIDLKLLLVEKLCTLHCLWKEQVIQYGCEITRLHNELQVHHETSQKLISDRERESILTESKLTKLLETEREKLSMMMQKSQRSQRMLESIQNECSMITNFIFSSAAPAGALDNCADLVNKISLSAQYDFGTGSYLAASSAPGMVANGIGNALSITAVEWLRNEKNLVFPLIELCNNNVDHSNSNKLPSISKLVPLGFRIIVFVNDSKEQSTASAKLQQELCAFHDRCLELGGKLSFNMEMLVVPVRNSERTDSDDSRSENLLSNQHVGISPGSLLLESSLPLTTIMSGSSSKLNESSLTSFILLEPQQEHELVSKATIKCLFRGLYQIAINSYLKYIHDKNINQIITHRRLHGINKLQSVQLKLQLEEYRKQVSYQSMKLKLLPKRIVERNEFQNKFLTFKHRATVLDQLTADWTELVKGMNAASRAIIGGLPSVWARSCHALLSVLSSRCSVNECGLIVLQENSSNEEGNRLVEYIVRNMTTPVALKQRRRHRNEKSLQDGNIQSIADETEDYVEYANANLERRSVQELGHRLTLQLLEIFGAAHYPTTSHAIQRLYKISNADDKDDVTYLIPVRTTFSVVAALRVTVENLRFNNNALDSPQSTVDVHISKSDVVSAVENNLVNFADMIAPALMASNELHACKENYQMVRDRFKSKDMDFKQLSSQWADLSMVFERFKDSMHRSNQALEELFYPTNAANSALVSDLGEWTLDDMLEQCCCTLTSVFSDIFGAEAEITIDKAALLGLAPGVNSNPNILRASMQSRGFPSDIAVQDEDDDFADRLMTATQRGAASRVNAHGLSINNQGKEQHHHIEIALQREPICDVLGRRIGEFRVSIKDNLSSTAAKESEDNTHNKHFYELSKTVLKSFASYIAFVMIQILDKHRLQKSIEQRQEKYSQLEHEYSLEIEKKKMIEEEKVTCYKSLGIQGKWTKISNNCLEYITSPTYHNFRFPSGLQQLVRGYSLTEVLTAESTNSLFSFLHSLLENTLSLLGRSQYGINLAVLDGKQDDFGVKKLIWIHGDIRSGGTELTTPAGDIPNANRNSTTGMLNWNNLPDNTKAIVVNMTNLCISTKQSTSIDVRHGFDSAMRNASLLENQKVGHSVVHVSVLPLFYSYSPKDHEEVIGALQILSFADDETDHREGLDESSQSNFHVGKEGLNEDILQDLTTLLSRLLSFEIVQTVHSHDCLSLEANLVTVRMKEQEEEHLHIYYEKLAKQWQMLTYLLRDLHQGFDKKIRHKQKPTDSKTHEKEKTKYFKHDQDFDDLIDIFNFESTRKYLHELGMTIRMKFGSSMEEIDSLSNKLSSISTNLGKLDGSVAPSGSNIVAKTVIPVFVAPLDPSVSAAVGDDAVNAHVEILLLDAYTSSLDIPTQSKLDLLSHSYDYVDIIAKTIQSLITQYHRVHGMAIESHQTVDSVRQELQKYKLKSSKYHQEVVDQRALLALKQEESHQIAQEMTSFQTKILQLVHSSTVVNPLAHLQSNIHDIVKRSLVSSSTGQLDGVDLNYFCKQSISAFQQAFDLYLKSWQKSNKSVKEHERKGLFTSHFSLLFRKEFVDRLQSGTVGSHSKGEGVACEEEKCYKEADLMKLVMYDGRRTDSFHQPMQGLDLLLIKQARLMRNREAKSKDQQLSNGSSNNNRDSLSSLNASALEKVFFNNEKVVMYDDLDELHQTDLIGVDEPIFLKGSRTNAKADQRYLLYCIGMSFGDTHKSVEEKERHNVNACDAVLRFICVLPNVTSMQELLHETKKISAPIATVVDPLVATTAATLGTSSHWCKQSLEKSFQLIESAFLSSLVSSGQLLHQFAFIVENAVKNSFVIPFMKDKVETHKQRMETLPTAQEDLIEISKAQLSRFKKLYKIVLRECSSLLDPPLIGIGGGAARPVHPASLAPLAASQDTCMKVLTLLRTLLRTEGQALLLKDITTVPHTYQLIYSGDALSWPGIEQNTFGVVTSHHHSHTGKYDNKTTLRASLVETVVSNRKTLISANAPVDERYASQIDGICSLGTPVIVVPIRGRGGGVVGVIIGAKGKESMGFTAEDTAAAEMVASLGALSLYWCQGLGSVHHTLHKTLHKMDKLEKAIQKKNANDA